GDGMPEHDALLRVLPRRLVCGLHHADGARRGLQAPVLEALHLEVEAAPEAGLAADEVVGRHPPVLERDLVGMHAAVADGVDGATLHPATAGLVLGEREAVPFAA